MSIQLQIICFQIPVLLVDLISKDGHNSFIPEV